MKIQNYSEKDDALVPGVLSADGSNTVQGRVIVGVADKVGFSSYEIQPPDGTTYRLVSPKHHEDQSQMNHIYYCIDGECEVILEGSGETFRITRNSVLALAPALRGTLKILGCSRMFVLYSKSISDDPSKPSPVLKKLKNLVDTDRDVDWHSGRSRRFLIGTDGFNISIHNTICYPNVDSPLWYKDNYELAYFLRGDLTYTWNGGSDAKSFKQDDQSDGGGWAVLMDDHDPHTVQAHQRECEAICVFYPPLKGTETHDFSKPGFSSF